MGAASYRYDGRGNLLVITSGLNVTNYSYDYANRLTQAVLPSGGGTYNYTYDADGRRVKQQTGLNITSYLWDEQGYGNVALEVNGANITNYLLGGGNLLSANRAGTLSDYLPDGNGNIRVLTNNTGSISDQYSYDAYTYIETGYPAGILSGFDPTTCTAHGLGSPCYLPNQPITRGQLTKLVVGAAHYSLYTQTTPTFSDVPPQNVFYVSIETVHNKGVINGYPDQTFRPNNNIRRDEMAQIVYKGVTTP